MRLDFVLHGHSGYIQVEFGLNTDPTLFGASPGAAGLPYLQASVTHPARGYLARTGWVQLVRSTDNRSGGSAFEMDPLEILGEASHPFCYYGVAPTLFDAPARDDRSTLDWLAHSFLTYLAGKDRREVRAVLGFGWGFRIRGGVVTAIEPSSLPHEDWDAHRALLTREYPGWRFGSGFGHG
jgi:hypothetical protein